MRSSRMLVSPRADCRWRRAAKASRPADVRQRRQQRATFHRTSTSSRRMATARRRRAWQQGTALRVSTRARTALRIIHRDALSSASTREGRCHLMRAATTADGRNFRRWRHARRNQQGQERCHRVRAKAVPMETAVPTTRREAPAPNLGTKLGITGPRAADTADTPVLRSA